MRDDFTEATKLLLAKRVGTVCSNPACSTPTYGPNYDPHKATSKGFAAHLTAAAPGGPRYDRTLSSTQRSALENGIWLCQSCSRLIDADPKEYTLSLLRSWRDKAEDRAKRALANPHLINAGPNFAETVLIVVVQRDPVPMEPPANFKIPPGHVARIKLTYRPVDVPHDLRGVQLGFQIRPDGAIPPGHCLLTLACQNLGAGIDQNVKFGVRYDSGAVVNHEVKKGERIALISGGSSGAWTAIFAIRDLLPGECQSAIVGAKDLPFEVEAWSQNSTRRILVAKSNF